MGVGALAPRILITRPEPQASRFATALAEFRAGGIRLVVAPLMAPEFLVPPLPERRDFTALVLTSETGARAAARLRTMGWTLPERAFCVGDRTAAAAADAGFAATSAGGDARDLVALIRGSAGTGALLYLHGRHRAADVGRSLPEREITSIAVYVQRALPLAPAARALLDGAHPVVLPLFSPRSARLFVAAAGTVAAPLFPVAISENARRALPPALAARTLVATCPDATAMMDAIRRLLASSRH